MVDHNRADPGVSQLMRPWIAVGAALIFLVLSSASRVCVAQQARARTEEVAGPVVDHGKQSFAAHCAMCHGLDGRGGEHAPGIVNSPATTARTNVELANIIRRGIPSAGMPSFYFLTNQQIETLIGYIHVLGGSSRTENLKGNPATGAKLFFGEARCSDCHMMDGQGGFIGSDLSEFGRTHTAKEIRHIILQPNKVLVPRWQLVKVVTKSGQHFSGLVRNEDNFSIALLSQEGVFHLLMKSDIARITREPRSIMPADYGRELNTKQLDDLVSYLILGSAHRNLRSRSASAATSK